MTKPELEMKNQNVKCLNPKCGLVFNNPIIVQNLRSEGTTSYRACPRCLTEIREKPMTEETRHNEEGKKVKQVKNKLAETKPFKEENVTRPAYIHFLTNRERSR